MKSEHQLLIASAVKLATLGEKVEAARDKLRRLAMAGVSYESPEMLAAYNDFKELDEQWKEIERQHLELRASIERD